MKNSFKYIIMAIIVGIVLTVWISTVEGNIDEEITPSTNSNNITVEQVHTLVKNHIKKMGYNIEIGSPEYVHYLENVLTIEGDKLLRTNQYYEEVKIYAACYMIKYPQYDESSLIHKLKLYKEIPDAMRGKTIKELAMLN